MFLITAETDERGKVIRAAKLSHCVMSAFPQKRTCERAD
jgi:hypothetical protein